jgi:hypothetical protein
MRDAPGKAAASNRARLGSVWAIALAVLLAGLAPAGSQEVRAVRYRGITPDADGQLWYAADQLVKVRLEVRGEPVDYRLVV